MSSAPPFFHALSSLCPSLPHAYHSVQYLRKASLNVPHRRKGQGKWMSQSDSLSTDTHATEAGPHCALTPAQRYDMGHNALLSHMPAVTASLTVSPRVLTDWGRPMIWELLQKKLGRQRWRSWSEGRHVERVRVNKTMRLISAKNKKSFSGVKMILKWKRTTEEEDNYRNFF